MSLLRDIQNDLSTKDGDLPTILRKCKILAARLGSAEFAHWVDWELNGYPDIEEIPLYRKLPNTCHANFMNTAWQAPNQPVPWAVFDQQTRDVLEFHEFREGIAGITPFLEHGGRVDMPQLALKVQGKIFPGMNCVGVWLEIGRPHVLQLVSAVKNRILDFVLTVESENPDAGEAPPNTYPIPLEKLQPIIHNYFGNVGNVAQSSQHVHQSATVGVTTDELTRLVSELTKHLAELELNAADEKTVRTQLSTIDVQVNGSPDPTIIAQAGRTIRSVTEGVIGSTIASAAQPHVWSWVHAVLTKF